MTYGYVYLIVEWGSTPERYKLGITKNDPKLRLKTHQTSNPHELVLIRTYKSEHYHKIESWMKREYFIYGQKGGTEWFELPSEIASNFTQECKRIEDVFNDLIKSGNPFI
jgi:hypothetical protein